MSEIHVIPPSEGTAHRPGGVLDLSFEWTLDRAPEILEARLFWFTRGKGDEDVGVVDTRVMSPRMRGNERIKFKLPDAPYSFSGRLITLAWAVELVAGSESARWEFMLAPDGKEVVLDRQVDARNFPASPERARVR